MTKLSSAEKALLQGDGIHVAPKPKSNAQRPLKKWGHAVLLILEMAPCIPLRLTASIRIHSFTISDGY